MKTKLLLSPVILAAGIGAQAALYAPYWDGINAVVPDGSAGGYQNSQTFSGLADIRITDVNVKLDIAGGYNGDLYAYLVHDSGLAVLLNRVGRESGSAFGFGDAGFNVKLDDQAAQATDIHLYQTVPGYSLVDWAQWRSDGRGIDPLTATSAFDSASRNRLLGSFNNLNPNGTWTIYLADLVNGNESTLIGWGLEIEAVPEPMAAGLIFFALLLGGMKALCWFTGSLDRQPDR